METYFSPRRAETTRKTKSFLLFTVRSHFPASVWSQLIKDCIVTSWSDPNVGKNKGVCFVFQSVNNHHHLRKLGFPARGILGRWLCLNSPTQFCFGNSMRAVGRRGVSRTAPGQLVWASLESVWKSMASPSLKNINVLLLKTSNRYFLKKSHRSYKRLTKFEYSKTVEVRKPRCLNVLS